MDRVSDPTSPNRRNVDAETPELRVLVPFVAYRSADHGESARDHERPEHDCQQAWRGAQSDAWTMHYGQFEDTE